MPRLTSHAFGRCLGIGPAYLGIGFSGTNQADIATAAGAVTYVDVNAVVAVVALVVSIGPARHAMHVDPLATIRAN